MTPWSAPALVAEAHAWLREVSAARGRPVRGPIAQPHVRSWSTVFRARTADGDVYLKLCGPSQAHEPALTALLASVRADVVPAVLAVHPERPWMLLADGGAKLRDAVSGPALLDAWAEVLPRYAELQRGLLGRADELLATGTPDHRIDRLAAQLGAVIEDERALAATDGDPLTPTYAELRELLPRIAGLAGELAALGIGETIDHNDLHDANVLVRNGRAVVFDWGDACVTHPFLSLSTVLRAAASRTGLGRDDRRVESLRDAYLEVWADCASPAALRAAAASGALLGGVARALIWHHVVATTPDALDP